MERTENKFKVNDVYRFSYHDDISKKSFTDIYHCFDGILVVKQRDDGTIYLQDTYWSGSDSRVIYIDDIDKKGKIKFLCNLDDMSSIEESDIVYYNDDDIIRLGIHAGYRTRFLIKKGVGRSKDKMIQSIEKKIYEKEREIEWNKNNIESLREKLDKVHGGDLDIYI